MRDKSASIVKATSFMAGNGIVLLKVYDVLNLNLRGHPRWTQQIVLLLALALPPIVGLVSGWILLARIEDGSYTGKARLDWWLDWICLLGIGVPLGLWMVRIVG